MTLVYSVDSKICCLSLKLGWLRILLASTGRITALCQVAHNPAVISFGQDSGVIKDFDTKLNQVVRRASLHSSRINLMQSRGKFLLSSSIDKIVVYDYSS